MKIKSIPKPLAITIVAALLLVFVIIIVAAPNADTTKQPTSPTEGTFLPDNIITEPTNPDSENPEYISPYDPDVNYCWTLMPVYQSNLNITNMMVTSPSEPDSTFITQINVEDVISVILQEQPSDIDINKLSIRGYAHNASPDPYTTPVEKLPTPIFSTTFAKKDTEYVAQFMIGYDWSVDWNINLFFIYDNQIVYFTMFMITEGNGTTDMYWEHYYPDETVKYFTITCDNNILKYPFFVKDDATLKTWVNDPTNIDEWMMHSNYLANEEENWFVPIEQCIVPLKDGMNFIATQEKPAEPEPFTFDDTNSEYLVSYIGATKDVVISEFGEPNSQEAMGSTTKLLYEHAAFYISNNTVTQIDILNFAVTPVNGLNAKPTNSYSIENTLNSLGIEIPKYKWITDTPSSYYCAKLPITHNNWTVCYVWESKEQFVPSEMNFTKIVIHSGEDYYY